MCGTDTQREVCARKDGTDTMETNASRSHRLARTTPKGSVAEDGIPKPQPQGNTNLTAFIFRIPAGCSDPSKEAFQAGRVYF